MRIITIFLFLQLAANFLFAHNLKASSLRTYKGWSYVIYLVLAIVIYPLPILWDMVASVFSGIDYVGFSGLDILLLFTLILLVAVAASQFIFNKEILDKKIDSQKESNLLD